MTNTNSGLFSQNNDTPNNHIDRSNGEDDSATMSPRKRARFNENLISSSSSSLPNGNVQNDINRPVSVPTFSDQNAPSTPRSILKKRAVSPLTGKTNTPAPDKKVDLAEPTLPIYGRSKTNKTACNSSFPSTCHPQTLREKYTQLLLSKSNSSFDKKSKSFNKLNSVQSGNNVIPYNDANKRTDATGKTLANKYQDRIPNTQLHSSTIMPDISARNPTKKRPFNLETDVLSSHSQDQQDDYSIKTAVDKAITELQSIYEKTTNVTRDEDIEKYLSYVNLSLKYIQNHPDQFKVPSTTHIDDTDDISPEENLIRLKIQIYGAFYFLISSKVKEISLGVLTAYAQCFISLSYKDLVHSSDILEKFNNNVSENKVQISGRGLKRRWSSPKKKKNKNALDVQENDTNIATNAATHSPPPSLSSSENTYLTLNSKLISFIVKCVDHVFSKAIPRNSKAMDQLSVSFVKLLRPDARDFYRHIIKQLYEQNLPKVSLFTFIFV